MSNLPMPGGATLAPLVTTDDTRPLAELLARIAMNAARRRGSAATT